MEDNKKKKLIRSIVLAGIDLVVALAIAYWRYTNPPFGYESISVFYSLADGLFAIGMLNFGIGALLWIMTTGVLDIISYGFKSLIYLFTPIKRNRDEGGYYEYLQKKKAERKPVPFETLWIGGTMIAISIIFTILEFTV